LGKTSLLAEAIAWNHRIMNATQNLPAIFEWISFFGFFRESNPKPNLKDMLEDLRHKTSQQFLPSSACLKSLSLEI
jgi:hypothetical protein